MNGRQSEYYNPLIIDFSNILILMISVRTGVYCKGLYCCGEEIHYLEGPLLVVRISS